MNFLGELQIRVFHVQFNYALGRYVAKDPKMFLPTKIRLTDDVYYVRLKEMEKPDTDARNAVDSSRLQSKRRFGRVFSFVTEFLERSVKITLI